MLKPEEIDDYFHAPAKTKAKANKNTLYHSRKVKLAKLVLPSLAGVLAITLLVFPSIKKDADEFALDFVISDGDIEKLNVEKTTIYLTDKNNRVNNFIASQVNETSAGSQKYNLVSPEAVIPLDNKEWISIKSPGGIYDQQTGILHLKNSVEVFFSKGMNIYTPEAFFNFKDSNGYTNSPIKGDGFIGKIDSQGLELSGKNSTLKFVGKTTLVIDEENIRKE